MERTGSGRGGSRSAIYCEARCRRTPRGSLEGPTLAIKGITHALGFSDPVLQALKDSRILGIRAGTKHRYTGVWVVVIDGRVFVRSWNDKPTGWYRAFRNEPRGRIQVGEREIDVRARHTRSERLREAVSRAYAEKYNTKASQEWVLGFAEAHRALTTLELVPV